MYEASDGEHPKPPRPQQKQASKPDITETTEIVNQAIRNGQTESLDMVIRARYACQWGNGDALHRELADEVERLRTIVQQRLEDEIPAYEPENEGKPGQRP